MIPLDHDIQYERIGVILQNQYYCEDGMPRLLSARWVRRDYRITEGSICAVPESKCVAYDPLEAYFAVAEGEGQATPLHIALAALSSEQERDIERFCSQWGLLGLYQHNLLGMTYVPGPRGGALPKHDPPGHYQEVTETAQFRLERNPRDTALADVLARQLSGGDQVADEVIGSQRERTLDALVRRVEEIQLVHWVEDKIKCGEAQVICQDGQPRIVPLIEYCYPFFPSSFGDVVAYGYGPDMLPMTVSSLPEFPTWSSGWLWDELTEPVAAFREAVAEYKIAYQLCSQWRSQIRVPKHVVASIEGVFSRHLYQTGMRLGFDVTTHRWKREYFCPSLLSAAYLQLMLSFTGGGDLRYCANEGCGHPFEADRANKLYCSILCQRAQQQRRFRRSKKD